MKKRVYLSSKWYDLLLLLWLSLRALPSDIILNAQVGLLCEAISKRLDGRPYALLGHSLGAMFAYEVAREMVRQNFPAPMHVCISSVLPPSHKNFKDHGGPMSDLSDAEFLTQAEERCWLVEMKDRAGKLETEFLHRH